MPNLVRTEIKFIGGDGEVAAIMDRLMNVLQPYKHGYDGDFLVGPIWCSARDELHREGIHLSHARKGYLPGQPGCRGDEVAALREDDTGIWVLTLRGVAMWTPPLEWIIDIAGEAVDIDVSAYEISNLYCQNWERREGRWRLVSCSENVYLEGPVCDYPLVWDPGEIYVRDGVVLQPLPDWVADAFFCLGVDSAQGIIGARWPEWEAAVLESYEHHGRHPPREAVFYASKVLGGRWSEVEPMLLDGVTKAVEHAEVVIDYVENVIQGQWPELEAIILEGGCRPVISVGYAQRIRKTRWPEVERVLLTYPHDEQLYDALVTYAAEIVGGQWREAEEIILSGPPDNNKAWAACRYARDVVKGRWPDGESMLATSTFSMLRYSDEVVRGWLPDHLHNQMMLSDADENVREYTKNNSGSKRAAYRSPPDAP